MTDDANDANGPRDDARGSGDDTRSEAAFRAAFARQAETFEPAPANELLAGVRLGRRGRLRRWAAPLAAAVAVGVIGVGLAVVLGQDGESPKPGAADVATDATPRAGWRYESIGNVSVQVPESWGYNWLPGDQWCVNEKEAKAAAAEPFVALRDGVSTLVLCTPDGETSPIFGDLPSRFWSTHIELGFVTPGALPEGEAEADGWTRIVRRSGDVLLTGYADAEHLEVIREVLASARIAEVDPLGCPTTAPASLRPPTAFDVREVETTRMVICQYYADGMVGPQSQSAGWPLQASREIPDPETLRRAIADAAPDGGPDRPKNCIVTEPGGPDFVLRLDTDQGLREIWGRAGNCRHNGLDDGTNVRELTAANCVPLWGERVRLLMGDGKVMERCWPS